MTQTVYILAPVRTPVARANRGAFAQVRPDDLLAHVIRACLAKVPQLNPADIEDVYVGCAMPEGSQGMNIARIGALLAGLPVTVPGITLNRFCCSGLQSVAMAADRIAAGHADVILAGGVESMSAVPMGGHDLSANLKYFEPDESLIGIAYGMGLTAEKVAERWKVSRADQDAFALESHRRALAALEAGHFRAEIEPFKVEQFKPSLTDGSIQNKSVLVSQDEGPRKDTSLEALAKLPTVFSPKGSVTAGNSSQVSDGAAMCLVVSEAFVKTNGLEPMARFCGYSVAGVPPEVMGIGPVEAIPRVLKRAGLSLPDMDWIELNEAFAAQSLAVIRTLNLNQGLVNPLGGAIALGHPLGATGAIRIATCLNGLERAKKRYGMITMCIGTGMGAAGIFENLRV